MLIEARCLTFRTAQSTILDDLSFQIAPGQHTLLLGPSGSGKTTLINIITGLMTPTCGEVWLSGRNISSLTGAARDKVRKEHIGLVFQTLRLISALSVRDNLLLAQHIASGRSDEGAADDLIARVGLSHRANARPRQLSQGESQRAAIARALCVRPSLVVADEPTSALDDNNAQAMMDLLFSAAEANGATLLIATHDHRIRDRFSNTISLNMQRAA